MTGCHAHIKLSGLYGAPSRMPSFALFQPRRPLRIGSTSHIDTLQCRARHARPEAQELADEEDGTILVQDRRNCYFVCLRNGYIPEKVQPIAAKPEAIHAMIAGDLVIVEEYIEEPDSAGEIEAQRYQAVDPDPPYDETAGETWNQLGLVVAGVAALAGILFFLRKRFSKGQLPTQIQETLDHRTLQREATARLNEFADILRNSNTASLSAKNLGDEGTAYVIEGLAFNERCATVDLSQNAIGPSGVAAVCQAMTHNQGVQELNMSTNNLGDEGAELLASFLANNASLQRLNLSSNSIGDKGATVLAEALKLNTTLQRLDLSGNAIDRSGTEAIAEALKGNSGLESLQINDNYLEEGGAKILAEALRENTILTELSLKGNDLGDAGVGHICEALLKRKCRIHALDLGNNNLTLEGVDPLVKLLEKAKPSDLSLYMNDLGNAGVSKIAAALKGNERLEALDINGNNVGPEGLIALANALKGKESLERLEISYNPIEASGAKALIDVIKFDLKVKSLKMGWCKLGKVEGAATVADLIMFNTTLNSLDVRGNGFEDNGAILLSRALKEHANEHLKELDLGYNEIKDDGACQLALALKNNPDNAPVNLKLNSNYISNFGQTALLEALDTVVEISGNRTMNITF